MNKKVILMILDGWGITQIQRYLQFIMQKRHLSTVYTKSIQTQAYARMENTLDFRGTNGKFRSWSYQP